MTTAMSAIDTCSELERLGEIVLTLSTPHWTTYVALALNTITIILFYIGYKSTFRQYNIQSSYLSEQLRQSKLDTTRSSQATQSAMLMSFLTLYMSEGAMQGRKRLAYAYKKRTRPDLSGSGELDVRTACEVYHLLGQLVITKCIDFNTVESAFGDELKMSWAAIASFRKENGNTLLRDWRDETGNDKYLHGFESLSNMLYDLLHQ